MTWWQWLITAICGWVALMALLVWALGRWMRACRRARDARPPRHARAADFVGAADDDVRDRSVPFKAVAGAPPWPLAEELPDEWTPQELAALREEGPASLAEEHERVLDFDEWAAEMAADIASWSTEDWARGHG